MTNKAAEVKLVDVNLQIKELERELRDLQKLTGIVTLQLN
jgi:hypothetical protein